MTFGEEVPVGSIGGGVSTTSLTLADTTGTSGVEKSFKSAVLEDTYNNHTFTTITFYMRMTS